MSPNSTRLAYANRRYSRRLPSAALKYLTARGIVDAAIAAAFLAALIGLVLPPGWKPAAFVILAVLSISGLALEIPFLSRIEIKYTSYEISENAIRIQRGALFHRDLVLATAQLLNVTVIDGPLLRRYGLVRVKFATLVGADVLGPVTVEEAHAIRAQALSLYVGAQEEG